MELTLPEKVKRTVVKYRMLDPGDRVVVGVSGGPDSLALLHVLVAMQSEYGLSLAVAHLNHRFRGEAADADAAYVQDLASRLGLAAWIETVDVPQLMADQGLSAEEAGRMARYDLFDRVAEEFAANRIAVGQNMDDQAETVLLRLLRGSGAEGLTGVAPVRENRVIRPLLEVSRPEIEAYCDRLGLIPRIDATNLEPVYLRNRVRLQLLPLLEREYNANIREVLTRTATLLRDEQDYLAGLTRKRLAAISRRQGDSRSLDLAALTGEHPAMQRRLLRECIRLVRGDLRGIGFAHIEKVRWLAREGQAGKRLNLPRGLVVEKEYGWLKVSSGGENSRPAAWAREIVVPGLTPVAEVGGSIATTLLDGARGGDGHRVDRQAFFDYDSLVLPLGVRSRCEGDIMQPRGMSGTRKLKEILREARIPRSQRDRVLLLVDGQNRILWVMGYKLAEGFQVRPDTARTLAVEIVEASPVEPAQ